MTPSLPTLSTARLVLRAWRDADRAPFAALNADPEVCAFLPGVLSRAESDAMVDGIVARAAHNGFGVWAVEAADLGFVGFVGMDVPSFTAPFTPCVELAWRLARPAWGRGLATEAARRVVHFAFEDAGRDELLAWTVPDNLRSRRVMEKLGMARAADLDFDHPKLPEGHRLRRHVVYRLRREQRG